MPSQDTVDRFVATVVSGDYVGAIERFYAPHAWMQENQGQRRVGRDVLVRHEQGMMSIFASIVCACVVPPLVSGDRVAIEWRFIFTPPTGAALTLHELAWQLWDGDQIVEEIFFYDPRQMNSPAA